MLHCPYDGYKLRRVSWGSYFRIAEIFYAYCWRGRHKFRIRITPGSPAEITFEALDPEEWVEAQHDYDAVEPRGG